MKNVAVEIARKDPARHQAYTAALDPLSGLVGKSIRPTLLLLLGAAGVLLLITCANVAALLLARSVARARDTAIRVALGAGQRRLALQYFVEGLIVSLAGAVVGVLVSIGLVRAVVAMAAEFIPRADEVAIDWRVLAVHARHGGVASALSSLAPLWQASRMPPNAVLTAGVRASAGLSTRRLSRSLVIAEIALAFALVAISGVLIAHLNAVKRIWPGFETKNLLTFGITLPDAITRARPARAASDEAGRRAHGHPRCHPRHVCQPGPARRLLSQHLALSRRPAARLRAAAEDGLPADHARLLRDAGDSAAAGTAPDLQDTSRRPTTKDPRRSTSPDPRRHQRGGGPALLAGSRRRGGLGQSAALKARFPSGGIVGDIRSDGLNNPPVPEVYMLHNVTAVNPMQMFVRSELPPGTLVPEIRRAIERLDPAQPIHGIATFADIVQESVTLERVGSFMTGFFALAALLMATLGIYGVVSYAVRQRTVEIGTRMALGADRRSARAHRRRRPEDGGARHRVRRRRGRGGRVGADADVRGARDRRAPFASAAAIIAGVAGTASFFPAWRATLLSPLVAIRDQPGSILQAAQRGVEFQFG